MKKIFLITMLPIYIYILVWGIQQASAITCDVYLPYAKYPDITPRKIARTLGDLKYCAIQSMNYGILSQKANFIKEPILEPNKYSPYGGPLKNAYDKPSDELLPKSTPTMRCQWKGDWSKYYDEVKTRTVKNCKSTWSGEVCENKEKEYTEQVLGFFQYIQECKQINPGQNVHEDGELNGPHLKYYTACGYLNPEPWQALWYYTSAYGSYKWDDKPPECVSAYTSNKPAAANDGTFVDDKKLQQDYDEAKTEASIVREWWWSWDGTWTNQNLFLRVLCRDEHSGCKITWWDDPSKKSRILKNYPLNNRQQKLDYTEFEDNVNNKSTECSAQYFGPTHISRSCMYKTNVWDLQAFASKITDSSIKQMATNRANSLARNGADISAREVRLFNDAAKAQWIAQPVKPVAETCKYNMAQWAKSGWTKFALIDKVNPDVSFSTSVNELNSIAQPSVDGAHFYAGEIPINITLKDESKWQAKTIGWVSGIAQYQMNIVQIKDYKNKPKNNNAYSQWGSVGEDMRRRSQESMDSEPSIEKNQNPVYIYQAGTYTISATVSDHAQNSGNGSATFTVNPRKEEIFKTVNKSIVDDCKKKITVNSIPAGCHFESGVITVEDSGSDSELFADANTQIKQKYHIYDRYLNPIYDKTLSEFKDKTDRGPQIQLNQLSLIDWSSAVSNQISNDNTNYQYSVKTDTDGAFYSRSFAYAPGLFIPIYTAKIQSWDQKYQNNNETSTIDIDSVNKEGKIIKNTNPPGEKDSRARDFFHIFTGEMAIGNDIDTRINMWVSNDIALYFAGTQNRENMPNSIIPKEFSVHNFLESITPNTKNKDRIIITKTEKYQKKVTKFQENNKLFRNNKGKVTVEQQTLENYFITGELGLTTNPWVSISITGIDNQKKEAKYFISRLRDDYTGTPLWYEQWSLNRIFIKGIKQTIGKEKYVTHQLNLTNTYPSNTIYNAIYKNASYLKRNRYENWKNVNGVLYYFNDSQKEKTFKISDIIDNHKTSPWNTLIIEDANLLIDRDIDSNKNLAIVVIQGKNKQSTEVQIIPSVSSIKSSIFVDGPIVSVNAKWDRYTNSNTTRSSELNRQLVFFGKIFSRNTIGGAVNGKNNTYILPRNFSVQETTNLDQAVYYDLSFLRMNNEEAAKNKKRNQGHMEAVVILDNPDFIRNPPQIFNIPR